MEKFTSFISRLRKSEMFKTKDLELIENMAKERRLKEYVFAAPEEVWNDSYTALSFKNVLHVYFEDLDVTIYNEAKNK